MCSRGGGEFRFVFEPTFLLLFFLWRKERLLIFATNDLFCLVREIFATDNAESCILFEPRRFFASLDDNALL